jgi:putative lipoic acid-binding regulatory protein
MLLRGFPNPGAFNSDGKRRIIEELVQFPTEFEFKVVGLRQGDFTDDVVGLVAGALQRAENLDVRNTTSRDDRVRITKVRDRGKYRSLTIVAFCETGAQVYSVYEALERDPRVLFKF